MEAHTWHPFSEVPITGHGCLLDISWESGRQRLVCFGLEKQFPAQIDSAVERLDSFSLEMTMH